jgi:hypothetical protein
MSEIFKLCELPEHQRDSHWEDKLLNLLPNCFFEVLQPQAQVGPDSWPYLFVQIKEDGEPAKKILEWLANRGIGLAINPDKKVPDFVLSYGMVWNFVKTGQFRVKSQSQKTSPSSEEFILSPHTKILAGPPSEDYLPPVPRKILKQFFLDQGVFLPKIVVLSKDRVNFDLCFSIESLGSPIQSEHKGILEAISWFLPAHYNLALIQEQDLPFVDL